MKPWRKAVNIVGGIMFALGGVCCLGIAIPNFMNFGKRSKAAEARSNLKSLLLAEQAHFAIDGGWATSFEELAFFPDRGNRYRYALSREGDVLVPGHADGGAHAILTVDLSRVTPREPDSAHAQAMPRALVDELGASDAGITIVASGNLDDDATLDVWSISSRDRTIDGAHVPAATTYNHVNDSQR